MSHCLHRKWVPSTETGRKGQWGECATDERQGEACAGRQEQRGAGSVEMPVRLLQRAEPVGRAQGSRTGAQAGGSPKHQANVCRPPEPCLRTQRSSWALLSFAESPQRRWGVVGGNSVLITWVLRIKLWLTLPGRGVGGGCEESRDVGALGTPRKALQAPQIQAIGKT